MNLNIINLDCSKWSKSDWQEAYTEYCKHNMFGVMAKKQYYDFVTERHNKIALRDKPLDPAIAAEWSAGRRAAKAWAEKNYPGQLDMNGCKKLTHKVLL